MNADAGNTCEKHHARVRPDVLRHLGPLDDLNADEAEQQVMAPVTAENGYSRVGFEPKGSSGFPRLLIWGNDGQDSDIFAPDPFLEVTHFPSKPQTFRKGNNTPQKGLCRAPLVAIKAIAIKSLSLRPRFCRMRLSHSRHKLYFDCAHAQSILGQPSELHRAARRVRRVRPPGPWAPLTGQSDKGDKERGQGTLPTDMPTAPPWKQRRDQGAKEHLLITSSHFLSSSA